ncbi:GNAT family N-acetyltransferase [Pseudomonas syringae]|nr:GNAT family N-acetyltransferase [Pseudomonas syringae]MBD8791980.1 GNAT family N-acetyltransferase [Pseudomonas syringae]MBD8801204.1 GNAT family N-acetyltransferase [Pseudomonas syringae]MBD8813445.1 GNAT family N-acetyltransferase [Pseudomonas syringae]
MDAHMTLAIETAEKEYLRARVENLARIAGNPYGARVFASNGLEGFDVQASPSPMLNRVYADSEAHAEALVERLAGCGSSSIVTPLTGTPASLAPFCLMAGRQLERLKGWTHLQFVSPIEQAVLKAHDFAIEPATEQTLAAFTALHASGFHTRPALLAVNQASFTGQGPSDALNIVVIKEAGEVVAGAALYVASNGVAYLGTAVTHKQARGRGYHSALIAHRIALARERGSDWVAATALANSRSRRNLQRAGLKVSHAQGLYRLKER